MTCGKEFSGLVYYNEDKVAEGVAFLLDAVGFGCAPQELTNKEKISRLQKQAALNRISKTKVVHFSLNFHPSENFSSDRLCEIAQSFMDKVGYGEQPFLIYQHMDAAHPHIHLVSTCIKDNGDRLPTHNVEKGIGYQACRELEKEYGLVSAAGYNLPKADAIPKIDASAVVYGKAQTKSTISNVVRSVLKKYKFTSLAELNAVLNGYNIVADAGKPDSILAKRGGLVYQMLDADKQKVGITIKASSIYGQPTLKKLEHSFSVNKSKRAQYRPRIIRLVDDALADGVDMDGLKDRLAATGIAIGLRYTQDGNIFGITFIDHSTGAVFNGSDLRKDLSAKGITGRLIGIDDAGTASNRQLIKKVFASTDYKKGFDHVVNYWKSQGLRMFIRRDYQGAPYFWFGHKDTAPSQFVPADAKMGAYLRLHVKGASPLPPEVTPGTQQPFYMVGIMEGGMADVADAAVGGIDQLVDDFLDANAGYSYVPAELLNGGRRKKKKKKRGFR